MIFLSREGQKRLSLLPPLKRARNFYLYDLHGHRWWDLYQNGGRALLSHRPQGLSLRLKNTLSCGLYAEYPSVYQQRVLKALEEIFPTFAAFRMYPSLAMAEHALSQKLVPIDPLTSSEAEVALWRPYVGTCPGARLVLPVIPWPGSCEIVIVAFQEAPCDLAPSPLLSGLLLSGFVKILSLLKKLLATPPPSHWSLWDKKSEWIRRGPYLLPREKDETSYAELFRAYFSRRILISPDPSLPSIIPITWEPGDMKTLNDNREVSL